MKVSCLGFFWLEGGDGRKDVRRLDGKAIKQTDEVQDRVRHMRRRDGGRRVFHKHRIKAVETAIGQGREDAAVEIDPGEEQGRDVETPQDLVERVVAEPGKSMLIRLNIFRSACDGGHRLCAPSAVDEYLAGANLIAIAGPRPAVGPFVEHIGWQVGGVFAHGPIDVNDRFVSLAERGAQVVDRPNNVRKPGDILAARRGEPAVLGQEVIFHVDDQKR